MDTKVIDSRDAEDVEVTRRRRECEKCEKRFTTYERVDLVDLYVQKKDGKREPFVREKLLAGIKSACEKCNVSHEQMERIVDDIERQLRQKEGTEVPSSLIGDLVMKRLKSLDKVAYIRFASVYREFADLEDFQEELKKLLKR